jgi:hypothetical protein
VRGINLEPRPHANADAQDTEHPLCLSYLEFEIDQSAAKHDGLSLHADSHGAGTRQLAVGEIIDSA